MKARLRICALVLPLVAAVLVPQGPVQAVDPAPTPEPLTYTTTVTETTYGAFGKVTGTQSYTTASASGGVPETSATTAVTAASTGGTSTASGCKKVSVGKLGYSYLGKHVWSFVNWTRWCWTRSTQVVYNVTSGYLFEILDSQYKWSGISQTVKEFYDYSTNDGHPKSAYKNLRTAHIENCVLKYGCIGDIYPSVLIRSYYNGTYVWELGG